MFTATALSLLPIALPPFAQARSLSLLSPSCHFYASSAPEKKSCVVFFVHSLVLILVGPLNGCATANDSPVCSPAS